MKDVIDALQTLVILLTLLAQVIMLVGIVYCFRFIIPLLKEISTLVASPRIMVQTSTVAAAEEKATAVPEGVAPAESPLPRYRCKCKVRLPEQPTHSVVEDEVMLLVYRCGRCGKEMKIDPKKETPVV